MDRSYRFSLWAALLALAGLSASCAPCRAGPETDFTAVGRCEIHKGLSEKTEYIVELGAGPGDAVILGVQGFHSGETSPHRIIAIALSNGERLLPERLSHECACGVKFRRMDAMYAFISTYKVALERGWLEEARESGLSM